MCIEFVKAILYIWKASYYESVMYKLDTYEKNGILLGDSLILFHETSNSPLSINVVKKYIELYLT